MRALLESLLGRPILLEQNGDDPVRGKLVDVRTDYATLLTHQNGPLHYPFAQIKTVSTNICELPTDDQILLPSYPETFRELLSSFLWQMVQIENGSGKRQGVLSELDEGQMSIVVDTKEFYFYPLDQIKNISPVIKVVAGSTGDPSGSTSSNSSTSTGSGTQGSSTKSESGSSRSTGGDNKASGSQAHSDSSKDTNVTASADNRSSKTENSAESREQNVSSESRRQRDFDDRSSANVFFAANKASTGQESGSVTQRRPSRRVNIDLAQRMLYSMLTENSDGSSTTSLKNRRGTGKSDSKTRSRMSGMSSPQLSLQVSSERQTKRQRKV